MRALARASPRPDALRPRTHIRRRARGSLLTRVDALRGLATARADRYGGAADKLRALTSARSRPSLLRDLRRRCVVRGGWRVRASPNSSARAESRGRADAGAVALDRARRSRRGTLKSYPPTRAPDPPRRPDRLSRAARPWRRERDAEGEPRRLQTLGVLRRTAGVSALARPGPARRALLSIRPKRGALFARRPPGAVDRLLAASGSRGGGAVAFSELGARLALAASGAEKSDPRRPARDAVTGRARRTHVGVVARFHNPHARPRARTCGSYLAPHLGRGKRRVIEALAVGSRSSAAQPVPSHRRRDARRASPAQCARA